MKNRHQNFSGDSRSGSAVSKQNEGGSITIIFIALLGIMMILLTADSRALLHLRREVKFMERQQIQRLNASSTNAVLSVAKP